MKLKIYPVKIKSLGKKATKKWLENYLKKFSTNLWKKSSLKLSRFLPCNISVQNLQAVDNYIKASVQNQTHTLSFIIIYCQSGFDLHIF